MERSGNEVSVMVAGQEYDLSHIADRMGYIREADFCRLCEITQGTAEAWRKRRLGPAWVRLGNAVFYPREAVAELLNERRRDPLADRREAAKGAL